MIILGSDDATSLCVVIAVNAVRESLANGITLIQVVACALLGCAVIC